MYPHRPRGFLREMPHAPLLFRFLNTAVLKKAAVIIVIEQSQRLVHRGISPQHRLAPRPIILARRRADYYPIKGVGLEVAAVGLTPLLGRLILVRCGQTRHADHLGLQPFGPRPTALPMAEGMHAAPASAPFACRRLNPGIGRHGANGFGGHHKGDPLLVEPQQRATVQKTLIQLLVVQTPGNPRIVPPGDLPTQPLRQVLGTLVIWLSHHSPASVAGVTAIEESGRQIKAPAYVGISARFPVVRLTEELDCGMIFVVKCLHLTIFKTAVATHVN